MIGDDFINGINDYQPKSNCKKTHVLESNNIGFPTFSLNFSKKILPMYRTWSVFFGCLFGGNIFFQPTNDPASGRRTKEVYVAVAFGNAYLTHFSLATLTSGEVAPTTAVPWCPEKNPWLFRVAYRGLYYPGMQAS